MFMRQKRTHFALRLAATSVLALSVVVPITSNVASAASITQPNGCVTNVSNVFSQMDMGIDGTGNPNPVNLGTPITLDGVVVTFAVSSTLIGAGISFGVISAAPDLANLGNQKINTPPNGATTGDINAGIIRVTLNPNDARLKITATNTHETVQTATNTVQIVTSFFATANVNDGSNLQIYSAVTNPPTPAPPRATPYPVDGGRTGTLVTGDLSVPIPLDGRSTGIAANALHQRTDGVARARCRPGELQ